MVVKPLTATWSRTDAFQVSSGGRTQRGATPVWASIAAWVMSI